MIALFSAILVASLLGSTHCAGMCGAFVAFAVSPQNPGEAASPRLTLNAAYNLGRLVTYATLGAVAGSLGAALDLGGSLIGVQRVALSVSAALMIGFGGAAILRHAGVRVPRAPLPGFLVRWARAGHTRALSLPPIGRAAAVGLLTTLLPCGWLYAFVIMAAGTASPVWGAGAMAAFWLGTLPMMAALGLGIRAVIGPLGRRMPMATSILLVAAGLWTLFGRVAMPAFSASSFRAPANVESAAAVLESAENACPLCHPKEK